MIDWKSLLEKSFPMTVSCLYIYLALTKCLYLFIYLFLQNPWPGMWKLPNRRVSWVLLGMLMILVTSYVHRTATEYEVFKNPNILSSQSQETENGLVYASNQSARGRSQQSSRKTGIHRDNEVITADFYFIFFL